MHRPCTLQPLTGDNHHVAFCRRQTSCIHWTSATQRPADRDASSLDRVRSRGHEAWAWLCSSFYLYLGRPSQRLEAQEQTRTTDPSNGLARKTAIATLTDGISTLSDLPLNQALRAAVSRSGCASFVNRLSTSSGRLFLGHHSPPRSARHWHPARLPTQPIRRPPAGLPAAFL